MGLLRFLFIAIAVLYIVRIIARLLLPMFFQKIVNKAQQQANNQYRQQQQPPRKPEGSIRVDYVPHEKRSSVPDSEGEYVSYEEVK
ncbi:DUF4834 family protein [Mucilaginibacter sp. UR6-1]|uniref:DUF4834 family protein n=1 Tax=Mucilaginibacter sp. UR6-1 TaxID=1435643 RepID=UPI001E610956|nr:DUF4834 family protein [Mucilaginibacter sp. UR6-1]MCC8409476.1 DUF4834 family protein [Mucilaginibacter sp. UR6-1]